jgi:hypothetical protein
MTMQKYGLFILIGLFIMSAGSMAAAQDQPMLQRGVQELGLSGLLDFNGPQGGIDVNLKASYGMFFNDFQEIGGYFNWEREFDGDVNRLGFGAFLEHHIPYKPHMYPYVGSDLGFLFTSISGGSDELSIVIVPRVGLKWFMRDYVAIDTNLFLKLATDNIYVNDGDLDKYDMGMNLGLRVYF